MLSMSSTEVIIEPGRAEQSYWRDLWRYRELFQVLGWRDVSVRYKQTLIGSAWAVIRPFLTMVVFTIIFGQLAKLPSEGTAPYALMVFAGILPWTFFATVLSDASGSLINNANLIGKVYFPRMIIPLATIVVALIDFAISLGIILVLMLWYQFLPSCPLSHSSPFWQPLGQASGSLHSTPNTVTSAMSYHSSCSWVSMFRRLASV
jgi:lipopolysaccharide transport system permease protein